LRALRDHHASGAPCAATAAPGYGARGEDQMTKHKPATQRIGGFSRNASDLFKIAVLLAGFDPLKLMKEIHRHAPQFATERTVASAMQKIRDEHNADATLYSQTDRRALLRELGEE
jgi:hypothetical protein